MQTFSMPLKSSLQSTLDAAQTKFNEAYTAHINGGIKNAIDGYFEVLRLNPDHADANYFLGTLALAQGKYLEAFNLVKKALQLSPQNFNAYETLGHALFGLEQFEKAIESYQRVIKWGKPTASTYLYCANVCFLANRFDEAIDLCDQAIAIDKQMSKAYGTKGMALHKLGMLNEAAACLEKAVTIDDKYIEAWDASGKLLLELRKFDSAIFSLKKAVDVGPATSERYTELGYAYDSAKQRPLAIACFDQAILLAPDNSRAHVLRGLSMMNDRNHKEAANSFESAYQLNPSLRNIAGFSLFSKMQICSWDSVERQSHDLVQRLKSHELAAPMQAVATLITSPVLQRTAAEDYIKSLNPGQGLGTLRPERASNGKICIGYFSSDFYNHATAHLVAELFELHDKERFEIIAFSFGPSNQDEMKNRLSNAFDKFLEIGDRSDDEVMELAKTHKLDIAIDLKGFTQGNRASLFARRLAPVQVNYLGYPGTMGATFMDYIVADEVVIPQALQHAYSEQIAYMPNSYQANDRKRRIDPVAVTRKEIGLPESGFIFCCFNNSYKITPSMFDCWMNILKKTDGSVLWLLDENETATKNLRKEAQLRGVDPGRLVFSARTKHELHLARHRLADLFLDTSPCNAHTTASDALWTNTPILTMPGETFASRVAASLLTAVDMPELIVKCDEDYIDLACDLANNRDHFVEIKNKLASNKGMAALFDTPRFTKNLENLYGQMYARSIELLAPAQIMVNEEY